MYCIVLNMKKAIIQILRVIFTLFLIELTLVAFNYFSMGGDYQYNCHLLNPSQAIYSSIAYLSETLHWNMYVAYPSILIICTLLLIFYYYLSILMFPIREKKSE